MLLPKDSWVILFNACEAKGGFHTLLKSNPSSIIYLCLLLSFLIFQRTDDGFGYLKKLIGDYFLALAQRCILNLDHCRILDG